MAAAMNATIVVESPRTKPPDVDANVPMTNGAIKPPSRPPLYASPMKNPLDAVFPIISARNGPAPAKMPFTLKPVKKIATIRTSALDDMM